MKPLWVTFIAGFVVLFSFQNCQQPPHMDELEGLAAANSQVSGGSAKINLGSQNLREFEVYLNLPEQIIRSGRTFSVMSQSTFKFEVQSGRISGAFSVVSEATGLAKPFCLNSQLKNELQSILSLSSVCKTEAVTADRICTQALVPAYAKIITENNDYELGAATDGCGSNSVDLCGSEKDLLKGFAQHLNTQLPNLLCN